MMTTCCVEGCKKTFTFDPVTINNVNPHLAYPVSFHRFPNKKILRQKWLTAIGRPNWDAPNTAHVCSRHFSQKQLDFLDDNVCKIKDEGYPDRVFPKLSHTGVEASKLKVCRFCLTTDVKMFSLESGVLKTCLETIIGLHENHDVDGLPQYLCYICSTYLLKMYNLIEKSMIAQATLLEIYAENLEITKKLIFEHNRQKLNLVHSLQSYNSTPCTVYDYVYDDNLNVSVLVTDRVEVEIKKEEDELTKDSSSGEMSDSESEQRAKHLNILCRKLRQDIDESENLFTEIYDEPLVLNDDISSESHIFNDSNTIHSKRSTKLKEYKDKNYNSRDTNKTTITKKYITFDSNNSQVYIRPEILNVYMKDHNYSSSYVDANKQKPIEVVKTAKQNNKNRSVRFNTPTENIKIAKVENIIVKNKSLPQESGNKMNAKPNIYPPHLDILDSYYNIEKLTKPKNRYACKDCGLKFSSKGKRWEHLPTCKERPLTPSLFRVTTGSMRGDKHGLKRVSSERRELHAPYAHAPRPKGEETSADFKPVKEASYECPICDDVFKTTVSLNQHIMDVHQRLQLKPPDSPKETSYSDYDKAIVCNPIEIRHKGNKSVRFEKNQRYGVDVSEVDSYSELTGTSDNEETATAEDSDPLKDDSESDCVKIETIDIDSSEEDF